jgi:hypothetical protein
MTENQYYLGADQTMLTSDAAREGLVHRLRQYLELRNVAFLLGNGCSIPLGSPVIGDVRTLRSELAAAPYRLSDEVAQGAAQALLDDLVREDVSIGLEPLLALLNNLRANAALLPGIPQFIGERPVDPVQLERL